MNDQEIFMREKDFIDKICDQYQYDRNIRHLLYLIIPAFIMKYGMSREKQILNTFQDISIISSEKENKTVKAYYSSTPKKVMGEYTTRKYMVIQNYKDISLIDLLDNLVHEFNHALNSSINEIKVTKQYLYIRTGLTYRIYQKDHLQFIKKDSSYILEEIINTKQTSDIINIIKGMQPSSRDMIDTIYAINGETSSHYLSDSYYLQSTICKEILENRTFISTLENLRITGEIYDIEKWFDDITGESNSYRKLNELLEKNYELEKKYAEQKIFKSFTLRKIRETSNNILKIIEKFNQNVNFK